MKKKILSISIVLLLILLSGCKKDTTNNDNTGTNTPTQPIATLPPENVPDNPSTDEGQDKNSYTLQDYFPIQADTEYVYEGKGNEYASYNVFTDFVDSANNKVQTRTSTGGTDLVRVIRIDDDNVSVIFSKGECYYRDNMLDKTTTEKAEVLLMKPLKKGTEWTLTGDKKRYISAVDVNVDTPTGQYKALEVTTEGSGETTKDYYAPKVGLVKSVYGSGDMEISSTLSEIKTNAPFTQILEVYYPDTDEKIHAESLGLTFRTGDITRKVFEEALRQEAIKESYVPLVSAKTVIKSLYLGDDNIVYVDFSADMIEDMNLGSGFETLVLQCITNTLGNYYGVEKVYLTIEGKPYESGHVLMKKGETFKVNMEGVLRE